MKDNKAMTYHNYKEILEAITDPISICSSDRRIAYLNPAMIKRLGWDATGEICHKVFQDSDQKCATCVFDMINFDKAIEDTIVSPLDNRTYRVKSMPIIRDKTISKLSILRDITEYIHTASETDKAQLQLIHSHKVESIGNLAGGIAHDFNNILASILGFTELALDSVKNGTQIEDNLKEIHQGAIRASDLVKQILLFARKSDEVVKPLKIAPIAEEALKFMRSSIPTSIEIIPNIKSNCQIVGNSTQIHQVFMNLCTNASHAMPDGGILKVDVMDTTFFKRMTNKYISLEPGTYVKIEVLDTGQGIPAEIIGSIFDPYFTTKKTGEGTGLGLAVVHGIIERSKGKIFVESEIDKGTKFTIYLPTTKEEIVYKAKFNEKKPTGNETILFVDDEPAIARLSMKYLSRLGYTVQTCTSSTDALDLFREKGDYFDLVITDMTMPKMTGDQFVSKIFEIKPDIPVILCTGYNKGIDEKKAKQIGVKALLFKPTRIADMANAIRDVLDGKSIT